MGQTFAEKIMGRKAGHMVRAGDTVVVEVDRMMATDTTAPLAIRAFEEMGGERLARPDRTVLVIDHATPCPNERIANLHRLMRDFARVHGAVLYDQNCGVCHQLMLEQGQVREGDLAIGADSHTCTYGAVGAFATGVGSTDLGAAMLAGKTWLLVPDSVRILMSGSLPKGVSAKDVILRIIGDVKSDGVTYQAVEFDGEGFAAMDTEQRMTVCNMVIEMGAKSGVFVPALRDQGLKPDPDALYLRTLCYRAEDMAPVVACPIRWTM
jgi:3-isopropylmalate/(R)-2-methylmalate dehydratase large subunit